MIGFVPYYNCGAKYAERHHTEGYPPPHESLIEQVPSIIPWIHALARVSRVSHNDTSPYRGHPVTDGLMHTQVFEQLLF